MSWTVFGVIITRKDVYALVDITPSYKWPNTYRWSSPASEPVRSKMLLDGARQALRVRKYVESNRGAWAGDRIPDIDQHLIAAAISLLGARRTDDPRFQRMSEHLMWQIADWFSCSANALTHELNPWVERLARLPEPYGLSLPDIETLRISPRYDHA